MNTEDIWKQLQDKVAENQVRWAEIDALYNEIKQVMVAPYGYGEYIKLIVSLLLLLTDQMRPMSTAGNEAGKLMEDISIMMGKLGMKV